MKFFSIIGFRTIKSLITFHKIRYGFFCRIRKLVKDLQEGKEPPQPQKTKSDVIKTNGQDTVLKAPKRNKDDRKFIQSIAKSVMKMQFDSENMPLKERDSHIIKNLSLMEKSGDFDRQ